MSNGWHERLLELITENGAMGVNQLQKEMDIPLSTLQKYLDKQQTFFRKNSNRKWDLPENVAEAEQETVSDNAAIVLESQITGITATFEMLKSQLNATTHLIASMKPPKASKTSVANTSKVIDPRLLEIQRKADMNAKAIKMHIDNVPEKYRELVMNMDSVAISLSADKSYIEEIVSREVVPLMTNNADSLSDEAVDVLSNYQKES